MPLQERGKGNFSIHMGLPLDGPDVCRILFEGIDVNHPVEHDGMKCSAGGITSLLRGD